MVRFLEDAERMMCLEGTIGRTKLVERSPESRCSLFFGSNIGLASATHLALQSLRCIKSIEIAKETGVMVWWVSFGERVSPYYTNFAVLCEFLPQADKNARAREQYQKRVTENRYKKDKTSERTEQKKHYVCYLDCSFTASVVAAALLDPTSPWLTSSFCAAAASSSC